MKILYTTVLLLIIPFLVFAQDDEYDDTYYEETEDLPLNSFFRITTNVFTVNSTPADIDFRLMEDDFFAPDTLSSSLTTADRLWTYGLSVELAQLFGDNYVWSFNNHLGWGDKFYFFTNITQIGVGKEFQLGKFYAQPMVSLGFISSSYWLDEFSGFDKGFFEYNGSIIISDLALKLKSRAFSISPSFSLDYPINDHLSIYTKGSVFYTFGRNTFVRLTGTTDQINEEGENITTYERINFTNRSFELNINNQPVTNAKSPFLHYNLNSVLIQFGITLSFSGLGAY